MTKTEKATQQMIAWANDPAHGYDQRYRWFELGDADCSSAVIQAWEDAGVPVKSNGASYTGNMYAVFIRCGFKDVTSQVDFNTGAGLKRGDVLLNINYHVAMYCGNGEEVEASINEFGGVTGGQPGDQTGWEFLVRPYRNYPWDVCLRYPEAEEPTTDYFRFTTSPIKVGDKGVDVWRLQMCLKARGYYTGLVNRVYTDELAGAVKAWQKKAGLPQTGNFDNKYDWPTLLGLKRDGDYWLIKPTTIGTMDSKDVYFPQQILKAAGYYTGKLDWDFGPLMYDGVCHFQKAAKLPINGKLDYATLRHMIGDK